MINRKLTNSIKELLRYYPVVTLTGPRQSGKTTLVKNLLTNYEYVTLENPDTKEFAESDPKGFLEQFKKGCIIDEIQRVPNLFSYIQTIVDDANKEGMFVLTGSQNFLLLEKITQTLAGRTAILKLLPFDNNELTDGGIIINDINEIALKGCYPRIYDKNIPIDKFYPFYIQTYVERDVKQIRNIANFSTFIRFIKLCAGRAGQILNISNIANDCDIKHETAKSWLALLQSSYLIYFLEPYHKNFNKRIIKSPKMYFYDTGLLCSLLGLKSTHQLIQYYNYGAIIENYVISDIKKRIHHNLLNTSMYYWRNKTGHEVDLILEKSENGTPVYIEVKGNKTISDKFFKNIDYLRKLSGELRKNSYIIYCGSQSYLSSVNKYISWNNNDVIDELIR